MKTALVYRLACSISSKEVLWFESADSKACVPPTVRHLSIEGTIYEVIKNISQTKELRLRTLVIKVDKDGDGFNEPKVAENINKLIKGSKGLRLLSLHGRNCSVLKIEFSKLKRIFAISRCQMLIDLIFIKCSSSITWRLSGSKVYYIWGKWV